MSIRPETKETLLKCEASSLRWPSLTTWKISRAISSAIKEERELLCLALFDLLPPLILSLFSEWGVPVNKFTITSSSLTVNCEQILVECSFQVGVYQLHIRLSAPVNLFELVLFSTALYSYYRVTLSVLEYFNNGWWLWTHPARQARCSGVPNTAENKQSSLQVRVWTGCSSHQILHNRVFVTNLQSIRMVIGCSRLGLPTSAYCKRKSVLHQARRKVYGTVFWSMSNWHVPRKCHWIGVRLVALLCAQVS